MKTVQSAMSAAILVAFLFMGVAAFGDEPSEFLAMADTLADGTATGGLEPEEPMAPVDASGGQWFGAVTYTYILDYGTENGSGVSTDYDASGNMYGITVGQLLENNRSWSLALSFTLDATMTGKAYGDKINGDMDRWDVEYVYTIPWDDREWLTWMDFGMQFGGKFAYAKKDWDWARQNAAGNNYKWSQDSVWVGPMIGFFMDVPFGQFNESLNGLSFFGNFNGMALYAYQGESGNRNTVGQPTGTSEYSTFGFGLNVLAGLRYSHQIEGCDIAAEVGFRGQYMTTGSDGYFDMYNGITGRLVLRF